MSTFPNTMGAQFANEIYEANTAALEKDTDYWMGPGPFVASYNRGRWYPTEGFRCLLQNGTKFKWTLNTRGDVGVISPTLKHSIASGGGDVWTAGHGTYNKETNTLTIDNDTGHYLTSTEGLERSRTAWESMGYKVIFQTRQDYAAALNRLAF